MVNIFRTGIHYTIFIKIIFLSFISPQAQDTLSEEAVEIISETVVNITVERSVGADRFGSGVIISEDGYILTSLDLVNFPDVERIIIATYVAVDKPPEDTYQAEVLFPSPTRLGQFDTEEIMNLAVLRVNADLSGSLINRAELNLNRIVEWSDTLENTDRVYLFAYTQSLGAGNITADSGIISADLGEELEFRSDTIFGEGSTGGIIINARGDMIGIATDVTDESDIASLTRFLPLKYICQEETAVCDLLPDGPPPVRTTTRAVVCIGINDILNLRSEPSRSGEVLSQLTFGTHVAVLGPSTPSDGFTWLELQTSDGTQGWSAEVINNSRTLIPYTSEETGDDQYPIVIGGRAIVCVPPTTISVNLRRSPGGFSEKQLLRGSVVEIISGPVSQDGTNWWNVIDIAGDTGWVAEIDSGVAILIGLPQ
jgi:hypothetical protein